MWTRFLRGNALEVLKDLPANFIDCVVTSPPYYLLRDYGQEAVFVWDGNPDCPHEWTDEVSFTARGSHKNANVGNNRKGLDPKAKRLGSFCKKCGAWLGQLGHEPHPDLYIKHLADIFDQVYRVLKPDGNVFIVIGDTYASGGIKNSFGKLSYVENMSFYGYAKQELLKQNKGTWIRGKQLMLIPYRFAIELQNRGWIVRDLIIWAKKVYSVNHNHQFGNGLPESVKDRLTKSYEVIIHAVKSERYYFNKPKVESKRVDAFQLKANTKEKPYNGKFLHTDPESMSSMRARLLRKSKFTNAEEVNVGSSLAGRVVKTMKKECVKEECKSVLPVYDAFAFVGNVIHCNTEPTKERHYAVMPSKLVEFLIRTGCREGGVVLDPFGGSGTTAKVAESLGRKWIMIEANGEYIQIAERRIKCG